MLVDQTYDIRERGIQDIMVDALKRWSSATDTAGWKKWDLKERWKMKSLLGPT